MKLVKTLLAATFALTAATAAFATTEQVEAEKVIVSTQEQPGTVTEEAVAAQPTIAQPSTESAAEDSTAPQIAQPNQ